MTVRPRGSRGAALVALALGRLGLAGCSTITPPPAAMALQGASEPVHSTSITAFGGAAAGALLDSSVGGGLRVSHRFSRSFSAGVDGVAGARVLTESFLTSAEVNPPTALYAGRAHLQYNLRGSQHLAFVVGLGGGALDDGLAYLTADVGVRVSGRFVRGLVEPCIGGVVAVSGPVAMPPLVPYVTPTGEATGEYVGRTYQPTVFAGLDPALVLHPAPRVDLALDVLVLAGRSGPNGVLLVVPTVGVRYRFGGADDPAAP